MAASGIKALPTIGFLTVVEDAEAGWTGGLLVLNAAGRPLEFHCTAPIRPNRAQEILYGPTLRPFVYGEQIAATLLAKAKTDTQFICTDVEPALCVRDAVALPVLLLTSNSVEPLEAPLDGSRQRTLRFDAPHPASRPAAAKLAEFNLGQRTVSVLARHAADKELILDRWPSFEGNLDLAEPFGRIREALAEAQRGAGK
jgi:hypothetical protein